MMPGLLASLGVLLMVTQVMAGAWTSHGFFYKPGMGARGEQEKTSFDSGLERVDTRLANEKWLNDPVYGGNLQAAITAIGNNPTILRLPAGTHSIDADLTIPANVTLKPERGAVFAIANTKTLTINGSLEAGPYQIFAGSGLTTFAAGTVVKTSWYFDFATAITKIGASIVSLEVTKSETINSVTTHVNTVLSVSSPGNVLSINGGEVLTIKGKLEAGKFRIFNGRISYAGTIIVQWWGARGDGLGLTPNDTGEDISTASWNSWDGRLFVTDADWSPFWTTGSLVLPTTRPFKNTDTWDYIGCNQALWTECPVMLMVTGTGSTYNSVARTVHFPAGVYKINVGDTQRGSLGAFNGLLIMRGQEGTFIGDGPQRTHIMAAEAPTFFDTNNKTTVDRYKVFSFYRNGPAQTVLKDMSIEGPVNYSSDCLNLTTAYIANANAVLFKDMWIVSAYTGVKVVDNCSSIYINGIVAEYLYGEIINIDATSGAGGCEIDLCELWDTAETASQKGVVAAGHVKISNSRFVGFRSGAVVAASAMLVGNKFRPLTQQPGVCVTLTHESLVSGNYFVGAYAASAIKIGHDSSITGNYFNLTGLHGALCVGNGSALSATNLSITGNTFIKTDATAQDQNYMIIAVVNGVSYTGAETSSTVIVGNTFNGRAFQFPTLLATMSKNTFNGVLGADSYEMATTAQLNAKTSAINTVGKTTGKAVYNTTTGRFVYSTGTTDVSVWDDAVGTAAHTPS